MNFLILGDGPAELAWAQVIQADPKHRSLLACPGLKALPELPRTDDLNAALATAELEALVVGGSPDLRSEGLRRASVGGLAILALHPPGPNADPYYQVSLSRQETGAVVVPDLPVRLHPGFEALEQAIRDGRLGEIRSIRLGATLNPSTEGRDLLGLALPRWVDGLRALLGEVETVNANGRPSNDRPIDGLTVHLRGNSGLAGEIRLDRGSPHLETSARWVVSGAQGSLALEHDPEFVGPSRLVERKAPDQEQTTELPSWEPKAALLDVLADSAAGSNRSPNLLDATRAMEIAEAASQSLRKGRTVNLHQEEISELSSFKSFMTSLGCGLLLLLPILYTLTRIGLALGLAWMGYLAWTLPALLLFFAMLQFLRFAARTGESKGPGAEPRP